MYPGKTSVLKQKESRKYRGCISSLTKPTLPHLECLNYPVASGQIHWKKHINICSKRTFQDVNGFRMTATAASSSAGTKWVPSTNGHITDTVITPDRISLAIRTMAPFKCPGIDGIYPILLHKGLQNLLKGLEKLVDRCLRNGPLESVPIHPRQHAFQAGKSTESALHQLVGRIEKALDAREYSLL